MCPGDHERIQPVSEMVREATAIADPSGADAAIGAVIEIYEDGDRPSTAVEDLFEC